MGVAADGTRPTVGHQRRYRRGTARGRGLGKERTEREILSLTSLFTFYLFYSLFTFYVLLVLLVYLSNVISWLGVHIFFGLSSNATSSSSFNMIVPGVVLS